MRRPGNAIYIVSNNNNFKFINYNLNRAIGIAPFNFILNKNLAKTWMDSEGTLFVATSTDTLFSIENANKMYHYNTEDSIYRYMPGLDRDSNFIVTIRTRPIKKFSLGKGIIPWSFLNDPGNKRILLIGTNNGLYSYDKQTGESTSYFKPDKPAPLTITNMQEDKFGASLWFSTLEKGMGRFNAFTNSLQYFAYPKTKSDNNTTFPINNFSQQSDKNFFAAIADSLSP